MENFNDLLDSVRFLIFLPIGYAITVLLIGGVINFVMEDRTGFRFAAKALSPSAKFPVRNWDNLLEWVVAFYLILASLAVLVLLFIFWVVGWAGLLAIGGVLLTLVVARYVVRLNRKLVAHVKDLEAHNK